VPANYSELATLSASPPSFSLQLVPPADRKKKTHLRVQLSKRVRQEREELRDPCLSPQSRAVEKPSRCRCAPGRQGNGRSRGRKRSPGTSPLPDRDAPAARRRLAYVCIGLLMTSLDGSENSSIKMDAIGRDYHRHRVIASYLTVLFCCFLKCSS